MKETVYGVFAVRGDGGIPSVVKLAGIILYTREDAALTAGNYKLAFASDFEVREIECEVK